MLRSSSAPRVLFEANMTTYNPGDVLDAYEVKRVLTSSGGFSGLYIATNKDIGGESAFIVLVLLLLFIRCVCLH